MQSTFTGTLGKMPEMSIQTKLGWEYLFDEDNPSWSCIRNNDGNWIVTDEANDLDHAMVFPDDDTLEIWLEDTVKENLSDNPAEFLSKIVKPSWLITDNVVNAILRDMAEESISANNPTGEDATERRYNAEEKLNEYNCGDFDEA